MMAPSKQDKKLNDPDPAQYKRFKEAARELCCEETPERMDEVIRRAAKLPPPRKKPTKVPRSKQTD